MKKVFSLCLVLITLNSYSQTPIDYNNFDTDLASKIFAKEFKKFRDTINAFGSGRLFSKNYPETVEYPELKIPRWSDYLYQQVTLPNCLELTKMGRNIYHVDREPWFKSNIGTIRKEYYRETPNIPEEQLLNARLSYSENAAATTRKFKTYEEIASFIILLWEKSITHRNGQRSILYDTWSYRHYNLKIQSMFSVCVKYNNYTDFTTVVMNFIK
jgi:hypothetical protein